MDLTSRKVLRPQGNPDAEALHCYSCTASDPFAKSPTKLYQNLPFLRNPWYDRQPSAFRLSLKTTQVGLKGRLAAGSHPTEVSFQPMSTVTSLSLPRSSATSPKLRSNLLCFCLLTTAAMKKVRPTPHTCPRTLTVRNHEAQRFVPNSTAPPRRSFTSDRRTSRTERLNV